MGHHYCFFHTFYFIKYYNTWSYYNACICDNVIIHCSTTSTTVMEYSVQDHSGELHYGIRPNNGIYLSFIKHVMSSTSIVFHYYKAWSYFNACICDNVAIHSSTVTKVMYITGYPLIITPYISALTASH
jgi:hypothetical protein